MCFWVSCQPSGLRYPRFLLLGFTLLITDHESLVTDHFSPLGYGLGRGAGVGRGLGVGVTLGVAVAVDVAVAVGVGLTVGVDVGLGAGPDCAQYLPPVSNSLPPKTKPPQTIISLSTHTAVCSSRAEGALVVLVATQLSELGLYLAPVFRSSKLLSCPPHTIISLPDHTAV
jgi:hypothetical protein